MTSSIWEGFNYGYGAADSCACGVALSACRRRLPEAYIGFSVCSTTLYDSSLSTAGVPMADHANPTAQAATADLHLSRSMNIDGRSMK